MGVHGSYCQLCRLPLQHDHYVASPSLGMFKIYRGGSSGGGHTWEDDEQVVRFTFEHEWLADAVALTRDNRLVTGVVEDGSLESPNGESVFIWDGDDEGFAYHAYCYELMGSPATVDELVSGHGTHGWSVMEPYAGQLFEMQELVDHGKAWALVSPRRPTDEGRRSRARIDDILARAKQPRVKPTTVADVLASDRGWHGSMHRGEEREPDHVVRVRTDVHPQLDCAAYPFLVWAMKEYGKEGMPPAATFDELERFEIAVKDAVEANAAAILLMTTVGRGQAQYIMHARDEAATRAAIDALPQGTTKLEYDNERDEQWRVFFEMRPPRR